MMAQKSLFLGWGFNLGFSSNVVRSPDHNPIEVIFSLIKF